jgi:glucose-1-phosphate cytidylyltransferase
MKVVILAGGHGTRLSEETGVRPKPMVDIGTKPMLWHIMKIYSAHGLNDFIICCGYKGDVIKQYFADYYLNSSDVTFDLQNNTMEIHKSNSESWRVTLVDTGENSMTGGRIKRAQKYIGGETFCLTYGDGVSDVDITALIKFHHSHGEAATLTAVQSPGRFGAFYLGEGQLQVSQFSEKPEEKNAWINGGFFVLNPEIFDYIDDDSTVWEHEPMQKLARSGKLYAYQHCGYWQPMDSLRDKVVIEECWQSGNAPWKIWD